jgi:hypothetical protein
MAIGASLPAGAITPDAARTLVTFLGLVAASVLPTVTLLVNSVSGAGRSIKGVTKLRDETGETIKALFIVLGFTGLSVLALVALSTPTPWEMPPVLSPDLRLRTGQAVALGLMLYTLDRTRVVPQGIYKCLAIKADIALDDAAQRTAENAPKPGEIAATFSNKPGFGAVRTLEEIRGK